jgi:hypothetical protein
MLPETHTAALLGVDGVAVRVEVDVAFGLPSLTVVGLAGSQVQEARASADGARCVSRGSRFPAHHSQPRPRGHHHARLEARVLRPEFATQRPIGCLKASSISAQCVNVMACPSPG